MRRVAIISPTATAGGSERALAALACELPREGVSPLSVLLEPGPLEQWLHDAGCAVILVRSGRTRHLHKTAAVLWRLDRIIRRHRTDVVISNQSKGHVLGGTAALMSRTPSIWWQHGIPERSRIERLAARVPAAAVVCTSDAAVAAQRSLTADRDVRKINPGLDIDAIAKSCGRGQAIREQLGWDDCPIVGIVGRLQPWKGQTIFLRAAARVLKTHPEVRFVVIGGAILGREGQYPAELERLAADLGIAERVCFAGHRLDVWDWFDALDVVVHASIGEPFGLVIVEGMALGKPLVATADGGPLEILEDGRSGLLVPPGDHERLAAGICRLLDEGELAEALAAGAAARARDFSAQRTARHFADLVAEVVQTTSARASVGEHGT